MSISGIISGTRLLDGTVADVKLGTISAGGKVSNSATTATNANTNSAIVARDGSGNFSASMISLSGTTTASTDVATKAYVDALVQGLSVRTSSRVATTAALATNNYNNGTSGVGATLTATTNAALVVDGVTVAVNDRILVKNEATGANNGIYTVTQTGSGAAPYILTRATDSNTAAGLAEGTFTFVEEGTTNSGNGFVNTTTGTITVGSTALTYTQFSGTGQITAGNGLTKTGNVIDVVAADSTITVAADSIAVGSNSLTNTHINSAAAIAYSKLNLATSIVNADISTSAAIAYSKLNLATSIVNADIAAGAAIVDTKLATISTAGKVSDSALSSNVDLLNGAQSITALKTVNITSSAGAETLFTYKVTGDSTGKLDVLNTSGSSTVLVPTLKGTGNAANNAISIIGAGTTDSGSTAAVVVDGRTAANGALATRPLMTVNNNGTVKVTVSAAGDITANSFAGSGSSLTSLNGTQVTSGTVADARLSANVALLNATQTFTNTSGNLFGASGAATPITVFRDATAGASTNPVSVQVGNSGSNQGQVNLTYTNAAATGSPTAKLAFSPRNNGDTTSNNSANITFTKTAAADTATIALSNAAGSLTLLANGLSQTTGVVAQGGGVDVNQIAAPQPSTVTQTGSAGSTTYFYWTVAIDAAGNKTTVSASRQTTTSNATLSGSNYNVISWAAVTGAVSYDVLRTTTGTTPSGTSTYLVGNTTALTINDQSNTVSSYTVPSVNNTGNITVDGTITATSSITASAFTGDGSALTSLNGTQITTGTVANARTTGTSSNTASTLVLRDGAGRAQFVDPSANQDAATKIYVDQRHVFNEVPSGTIDGTNATFTLANTPVSGTVRVIVSGIRMLPTTHYTVSSATITFVSGYQPASGEYLLADYQK